MSFHLDLRVDLFDLALLPDDHSGSDRANGDLSVQLLLPPCVIFFLHDPFRVGEEWKREFVLLGPLLLGGRSIPADPYDPDVLTLKVF